MSKFRFELIGRSPLLMHADDVEKADELETWRKNPDNKKNSKAGDDRSPPWTWLTYLYVDQHTNMLAIPADNIMVALRHAGSQIVMKKQTTFKAASQSGLLIFDEMCAFEGAHGPVKYPDLLEIRDLPFVEQSRRAKELGFSLFVKRAAVGQSKHVRVRARFDDWRCAGSIEVIDPVITDDVLKQLFTRAGMYAGLCDWRPSSPMRPGRFGLFDVKLKRA